MSESHERKHGFLSTLPGIVTAVATLITAVGGLIAILFQFGVFGPGNQIAPDPGAGGTTTSNDMPLALTLAVPQNGSTVSQPYIQPWWFTWDEPRDDGRVQRYHLRVVGDHAAYPLVDVKTNETEYKIPQRCSYIIDSNRMGWKWQVRALFQDGNWGPWVEQSTFNVSAFDRTLFCVRCPGLCVN